MASSTAVVILRNSTVDRLTIYSSVRNTTIGIVNSFFEPPLEAPSLSIVMPPECTVLSLCHPRADCINKSSGGVTCSCGAAFRSGEPLAGAYYAGDCIDRCPNPGHFFSERNGSCDECRPGYYKPASKEAYRCLPCDPGFFSAPAGSDRCPSCDDYLDGNCFQDEPGSKNCKPCPTGTSRRPGSSGTNRTDCQYAFALRCDFSGGKAIYHMFMCDENTRVVLARMCVVYERFQCAPRRDTGARSIIGGTTACLAFLVGRAP